LGLMDVTIITTGTSATVHILDENDDRRVRTSVSTVSGMACGIADIIGRNDNDCVKMFYLVHEFRDRRGEAMTAMFGRSQPHESLASGASPNRPK
ncbi:hypothetical protein FPV67DRAFT_1413241, partial [Lyophyllum atratum]